MACTKEDMKFGGRSRDAGVSVSDTLLLATMCMIGMPVDVQAKDGSVYSGIFHTACVDDDYAIVLRKAMLLKKGDQFANVVGDTLIETLVVGSEDLVQVVVKGGLISSAETTRCSKDALSNAEGCREALDTESEVVECIQTRPGNDNLLKDSLGHYDGSIEKMDTRLSFSVNERTEADRTYLIEGAYENDPVAEDATPSDEVEVSNRDNICDNQSAASQDSNLNCAHQESQGLSSGFSKALEEDQSSERCITNDAAVDSKIAYSTVSIESSLVPPKSASTKKISESSKLNPGAKIFSPSTVYNRTNTNAFPYISSANYTMTSLANVQHDVDASSFGPPPFPLKYLPYVTSNEGMYLHPKRREKNAVAHKVSTGEIANRGQPIMYTSQYQSIPMGTPYIVSNSQNDALQSVASFSPAATPRPLLNPLQANISKHQRTALPQALQVTMPPGQVQFLMPAYFSLPPPFPVSYPVTVPGRMGS